MFIKPDVRVMWLHSFTSTVYGNVMAGTTKLVKQSEAEKLAKLRHAKIIEQSQGAIAETETKEDAPRVKRSYTKRSETAPKGDLD